MARLAVLGESVRVEGYELAGALVLPADTAAEIDRAWESLPGDVAVVVLTPAAAARLAADGPGSPPRTPSRRNADGVLTVVLPG